MKTIILAAGYATRMYPLTENFPKPLLDVGGLPIIDYLVKDIFSFSRDEIYVVTNARFYGTFSNWLDDYKEYKKNVIVISDNTYTNETRLGALRDIIYVLDKEKIDDDVLVLAGDNLLDFSLFGFVSYAKEKKASCVMRHYEENEDKLRKTGVCVIDDSERIISMEEKPKAPKSHWAVPPFYYYTKDDITLLYRAVEEGISTDAPGSFISYLAKVSSVYAYPMSGLRYDVGSIDGYEKIKSEYKGIKS